MEEKKRLTAVKRSDTELDLRNVMLEKKAHNNILGTEDTQSDSLEMDFNKKSVKKGGNLDSAVVIRLIRDEKDIEATWPLYLSFHKESRYKNLPAETAEKTRRLESVRKHFLQNPKQYGMFIAEINGKPIGFLHCVMSQLLYTKYLSSSVLGFYVSPSYRDTLLGGRVVLKLLHAYRVWAKQRQAVEIQVHVTHGFNLKKIHRFFKKLGFQMVGANYSMEI